MNNQLITLFNYTNNKLDPISALCRLNGLPSTDRLREFAQPADRPLKDCAVHFAGCPFSMFDYLQIS